jgi:hypothetical protein
MPYPCTDFCFGGATVNLEAFHGDRSTAFSKAAPPRLGLSPRHSNYGYSGSLAPSSLPSPTTEAIINALFSPYETPSTALSPFTIPASLESSTSTPTPRTEVASPEHPSDDAASRSLERERRRPFRRQHTLDLLALRRRDTGASTGGVEKKGRWWKIGSTNTPRPSTPTANEPAASSGDDRETQRSTSPPRDTHQSTSASPPTTSYDNSTMRNPPPTIAITRHSHTEVL